MTEQMKCFLEELAELMERYDIESFQTTETAHGQMGFTTDGVEVTILGKYDYENDKEVQSPCDVELPTCFDAETIRQLLEGNT